MLDQRAAECHRLLADRNERYKEFGDDADESIRFVLSRALPLLIAVSSAALRPPDSLQHAA